MSAKRVADGIYMRGGSYYERPWVNGKRTFRKLPAKTLKQAKEIYHSRRERQRLSKEGIGESPYSRPKARTVADVLRQYREDGCPDRAMNRRPATWQAQEITRCNTLEAWFGTSLAVKVDPPMLDQYAKERMARITRGTGERTVDVEIQTLVNAYVHGVRVGIVAANPITIRPKYYRPQDARRCRDCAPETTEELHRLAMYFFEDSRSEVFGWQALFEAMTGVRTNEALILRWDAEKGQPGFIQGEKWLWLHRSKKGVNPFVVLFPELTEMLGAMKAWHDSRWPDSPWFFPSPRLGGVNPLEKTGLVQALRRACKVVSDGKPRTSHGLRAYYVTLRRSQGAPDGQIAAEIGDKTASLIETTYGAIPPNWRGSEPLSWIPKDFPPAWQRFSGIRGGISEEG